MANPTSNFGWQMPTPTDLVTDLPADFEVFGQAVDTSLADLKGGTSGQVLSKNSNTDMDFVWVAQDDSNAIQNAIVDAKGDLIAATGADTPARLAVGTNGYVLSADSTTATGLAYVPNSGPSFGVSRSGDQTTTQNAATKIQFNYEIWDTANCFDSTTNYRFTPNLAGYYQLNVEVTVADLAGDSFPAIYKNGNQYLQFSRVLPQGTGAGASTIMYFNGTTDYAEVYVYCTGAGAGVRGINQTAGCLFNGVWIRS